MKFIQKAKNYVADLTNKIQLAVNGALMSALGLMFTTLVASSPADAQTFADIKNSIVTNFIVPSIDLIKWGCLLAGGGIVSVGLFNAYKKSTDGGERVEMKSIFVPIIIGGSLTVIGFIVASMSSSVNAGNGTGATVGAGQAF